MRRFLQSFLLACLLLSTACSASLPGAKSLEPSALPPASQAASPAANTPLPTDTPTPVPTPTPTLQPEARVQNGDDALWYGDYDTAVREYQSVLVGNPDPELASAAHLGLGKIALYQDRFIDALNEFRSAIDMAPQSTSASRAHLLMGQGLAEISRFSEAAAEFALYQQMRPGFLDSYAAELRGDALAADGDYTGAVSAYQEARQAPRLGGAYDLGLKIAQAYYSASDFASAVTEYQAVYDASSSDYDKAAADYGMGSAMLALGQYEQGYEKFQDAVNNFPRAYSSYQSLVELVDAGASVDDLSRGLVDYFAGQYTPALNAFDRYLAEGGTDTGTALHYKSLVLVELGDPASAVSVWQYLIDNLPGDRFWPTAWEEQAYARWAYLDDPAGAAAGLLVFADQNPQHAQAPEFLFQAGRYLERADRLGEAAAAWSRVVDSYPASENAYRALFLAGVCRYRLGDLEGAKTTFQRGLLLSTEPADLAASYYWTGKIQADQGDTASAESSWQQAVVRDPTGYYSERARDRLLNRQPFATSESIDYGYDLAAEKREAIPWMRSTFAIPEGTDLASLGDLASDPRLVRGQGYWDLGLYNEARLEFESLRKDYSGDPANSFRLAGYLNELGLYRSAITAARQVLTLANLDDNASLNAPAYFNHIRFAPNFRPLVFSAAQEEGFSPLFLFSLIRQESLFEGFVVSSAGARGLMQIMPATGEQVAGNMGWPAGYTSSDLYRPLVSIRLGAHYLTRQLAAFNGDYYAALAAYNGGPGNAAAWGALSGGDMDLFLEVIRIQESRDYLMRIFEIFSIYRRIYGRTP